MEIGDGGLKQLGYPCSPKAAGSLPLQGVGGSFRPAALLGHWSVVSGKEKQLTTVQTRHVASLRQRTLSSHSKRGVG
ncbi:MAG: hypothetical protein LDL41_15730 [Coleofasciculus sp. S288]|nr:hypothetical protein [Coleofasciculus sp. S288]